MDEEWECIVPPVRVQCDAGRGRRIKISSLCDSRAPLLGEEGPGEGGTMPSHSSIHTACGSLLSLLVFGAVIIGQSVWAEG